MSKGSDVKTYLASLIKVCIPASMHARIWALLQLWPAE